MTLTLTLPEGATPTPAGWCARCGYIDKFELHARLDCGIQPRPREVTEEFRDALCLTLLRLYPTQTRAFPADETAARIRRAVLQWADDYVPDPNRTCY
jgi:hypothetical protein